MMKRVFFISMSLIFLCLFVSCKNDKAENISAKEEASKNNGPNIVLIMTDQHQAEALSIAGNTELSTPNLDKLAKSGVRFENAYVTFPLCSPSRSSMFTGKMPHQVGINSNADKKLDTEYINQNLPHLLSANGYDCAYGGKWHAPEVEIDLESGFEKISEFGDIGLAENTIAYMESKKDGDTPFFLVASFDNPHTICEWARNQPLPYGNIDLVDKFQTPDLPVNFKKADDFPEALQIEQDADKLSYPTQNYTEDDWRQYRYTYYRLIEKVDVEIGKILDAIDDLGLRENTIVIFTSDHGDGNASHGWNQKTALFQESINVPFIIRDPLMSQGEHKLSDQLISTGLDFYPTVLDYAGMKPTDALLGKSIRSLIQDSTYKNHDFVVTETKFDSKNSYGTLGRAVTDKNYKYVVYSWGKDREQFFDLRSDPYEMTNLADDPEHLSMVDHYRQRLIDWCIHTNDHQFLKRAILPSTSDMPAQNLFNKPY
ncbi:sulfatase family protein [Gelidibacter maritimus]|uniref:Sulfatase-like hydrolase/transferase n=1 Tax=Gelidibacter maritimus TaxID=2761487 RepID=A0A7W2M7E2_9FLAO|nr:sulfatase-like hydrolase/transferase [Gelidibacter maritimus]MBA6154043.1 sulfatase-like hydrolase/transferase [Gelidibacter maritimus]